MQPPFTRSDWQFLQSRNNFNLLKHRYSPKLCQQYILQTFTSQQKSAWLKRLKINHPNILSVLGCQLFSPLSTEDKFSLRIYLQSTTQRFSQLWNISKDQEAEIIPKVMRGFRELYYEYGGFKIQPSMIGLTIEREVKVWKSANFLENKSWENGMVDEGVMVRGILGLFKGVVPEGVLEEVRGFEDGIRICQNIRGSYVTRRKPISDLLVMGERDEELEMRSSYVTEAPRFLVFKKEKDKSTETITNVTVRDTLKIPPGIETDTNRTTLKTIHTPLIPPLPLPSKIDIPSQLFSSPKTIDQKLNIIEDFLSRDKESSSARLCIIFKHSYYHDKEMFDELWKVRGRIVEICDIKMLQRITEIVQKEVRGGEGEEEAFKKTRSPRMSLVEIERIKRRATNQWKGESTEPRRREEKTERLEPARVLTKEERIKQAMNMKKEAEKLLFG